MKAAITVPDAFAERPQHDLDARNSGRGQPSATAHGHARGIRGNTRSALPCHSYDFGEPCPGCGQQPCVCGG